MFERVVQLILAAVILGLGVGGCLAMGARQPPPSSPEPEGQLPLVRVQPVRDLQGTLDLEVDGQVVPFREVTLSAEVAGTMTYASPWCRPGNYVSSGERLVGIEARQYELEVSRLAKQVEQAEASIRELDQEVVNLQRLDELAKQDVTLQENEVRRLEKLGRNAASDSEVDKARRAVLTARNAQITLENQQALLNTRRSRLVAAQTLAEVQLARAELDLKRTAITAPMSGVVVSEDIEVGSYVSPGKSLVTLVDNSKLEVRCYLRMEELYWIWDQDAGTRGGSAEPPRTAPAGKPTAELDAGAGSQLVSQPPAPLPPMPPEAGEAQRSGDPAADALERDESTRTGYDLPATRATVIYHLAGQGDVEYRWEGRLERFDGLGLDPATRTVPCRVVVDSPRDVQMYREGRLVELARGPRELVQGMYVRVVLHVSPATPILELPESAVSLRDDAVWQFTADGNWTKKVEEGDLTRHDGLRRITQREGRDGKRYWLVDGSRSGLRAGDWVVVMGLELGATSGARAEAERQGVPGGVEGTRR